MTATILNPAMSGLIGAADLKPTSQAYTDIKGLEPLKHASNSPQALQSVAKQVEAMFLQMMLKSMREAGFGDDVFGSNEGKLYQDMFDQQISLEMSQRQDVGIGALLMRQLSQKSMAEAVSPAAPTTAPMASPRTGAVGLDTAPSSTSLPAPTPAQFVAQILPAVRRAAAQLGVSSEALLAQAALETGWGKRVAKAADGSSSNNLFGVKATDGWSGSRVVADTVEFDGTIAKRQRAVFRAYGSIEDSVQDFAHLLANSPRFKDVVATGVNGSAYAAAMGASGYATDPDYGNKINQVLQSDAMRGALLIRLAGLQK